MFADIASEMIYPVIPVYLKEIGFSVLLIGILEGVAEFTVGLSKGYFGKLSDEKGVRLPFIKLGYFLSSVSKPMLAIFTFPWWIFFARTIDRLGKGIRIAARDALLSEQATRETKATIFGFHRGWDTAGAVIGPILALIFLHFSPSGYRTLFYIAFIPGLVSISLIFLIKEKRIQRGKITRQNFFSFFSYWNSAPKEYKRLLAGLVFFAVANSSDVFLLLRAKEITGSDNITISGYIFYNIVFALSSFPFGILADRIGLKRVLIAGLFTFSVVYAGFSFVKSSHQIFILFFLYGLYAAATEGIAKAWITNIAHHESTATAIGLYTSFQSICTLVASILAGALWASFGPPATFLLTSILALAVIPIIFSIREDPASSNGQDRQVTP
jgi:MFS family permease